ncbi:hypothetical protein C8A00DRAFT_16804 [Chaetomidium leptoderma]|uniref:Uncharacterized protein n=1 Tax=Chaetomidium leptoderma TaxID=669021 RepID=A0AAN6VID2_9PEZI|nr:hypothetical protein C8A00DRAFT_16804 [Chaetomidium leptoderma]
MRSQLWLLVASGHLASADWAFGQKLDYRGGEADYLLPRQTTASNHDGTNGWTPRPTDGPSMELARRRNQGAKLRRQEDNTWVDETTCGWRANTASEPFACPASYSCATNTNQVVGCTSSGAANPFFTVCLDYQAVQAGACETVGPQTGCCMTKSLGECITYLWPGSTVKSMYRCYTERAVITMLDQPQSVIDEKTRTTSTPSTSSSQSTSETSTTGSASAPAQETTGALPPASAGSSNNTGAIVGGVVGGVAGLAIIAGAIAFFLIRSRKKKNNVGTGGTGYSAVAPGDQGYPGGPTTHTGYPPSSVSPQVSQAGYFSPGSVGTILHNDAPYMASTTPVPGVYDPRVSSYYDPSKMAEQQQHGQPGYAPYSGSPPPPGVYPGHYPAQQVSELDTTNVPAGHQSNPVEMAAAPPTQR